MTQNKITELRQTPIKQLLWRYFWPSFIGVMANSLYNIVDRIFIGRILGAEALSGVTAVFPVMIIMTAFGMLIGIGSSVQLSISLGKKDINNAKKILGNAVILIILISGLVTAIGFAFKEPMLKLFGAGNTTIGYAKDYLDLILWATLLHEFGFSMNALIRAEGNARIAMYSMLISAGINIPLDALFILHWNMGVQGAAYATIISMAVLSLWVLFHFKSNRCVVQLKKKYIHLNFKLVLAILSIGVSPFLMQLANSIVQASFNINLVKYGGDLAVGTMGIINSVMVIIITSIVALNMASQPIISFNFGAKKYLRVKQTFKLSMLIASIIASSFWVIVHTFPTAIVKTFLNDDLQLIQMGVRGMHIFMIAMPLIGFQIVAGNYFQSVGKASTAIFLTLLRQVIVLIPLLWILPYFYGLTGVWMSAPIADTIAAVICLIFVIHEWKRINKQLAF